MHSLIRSSFVTALIVTAATAAMADTHSHGVHDVHVVKPATFVGARTAAAFAPGGEGVALLSGVELGIVAKEGVGFGLHVFGAMNNPAVPAFGVPPTAWGFGAAGDVRFYLQTLDTLTFYPILSLGFLAGPGPDGKNVVMPLVNPGIGARIQLAESIYTSVEVGAAAFHIPYMAVSLGWSPQG